MPYDLQSVTAPTVRGWSLRVLTRLLENPLSRAVLLPALLKNSGLLEFRKKRPQAVPTFYPLKPASTPAGAISDESRRQLADQVAQLSPAAPPAGFRLPSITDYASAYRSQSLTPDDVAEHLRTQIELSNTTQPALRAIIKSNTEDLLQQARESTQRLRSGRPRSVLEGVPVAIKDEVDLVPYGTSVGTRFLGQHAATSDATAVARLRAAGALLIGKANMYEIGIAPMGNNPNYGFARNPHNLQHDAGGSSSGCGAAVAAGLVPLALGADGGGSVRVPAAHCGVVGLKPTFGRMSEAGAAPLCWSVAHLGPLAATAMDAAIGYALCAGPDERDALSLRQPAVTLEDLQQCDLFGVRMGVYEPWFEDADPDVVMRCEATLKILEQAGAQRVSVEIAGLNDMRLAHAVTILSEMATGMEQNYDRHRRQFAHAVRINLVVARQFSNRDYVRAQQIRTESLSEWNRVLSDVDVVMTPTTACTAPALHPHSEKWGESDISTISQLMKYVVPGNFCGNPSISFPAGYDRHGLPVGLQATGRHWDEALLLRLARVAEQQVERRQPAVWCSPLSS